MKIKLFRKVINDFYKENKEGEIKFICDPIETPRYRNFKLIPVHVFKDTEITIHLKPEGITTRWEESDRRIEIKEAYEKDKTDFKCILECAWKICEELEVIRFRQNNLNQALLRLQQKQNKSEE